MYNVYGAWSVGVVGNEAVGGTSSSYINHPFGFYITIERVSGSIAEGATVGARVYIRSQSPFNRSSSAQGFINGYYPVQIGYRATKLM